ncbi:hypothetical protein H0A36_25460 [Endozoicomonas sp. SM1973]|uniref:Uncharacterized protein n=1 Tax=Spartinivicinus marinus TaxID=2994442 RepID=A0A853IH65_9GAMM|nr:hypothetical protein [Spartinivicinus marinus]MCX4026844.1 hypothetical protein [Spartinivicinus marinus]NYZ69371.1 hypothetical protein [Spartinivicinus marinus]
MNYSDIIQALENATAFDLYRLSRAIDNMINDPIRLLEAKACLRVGDTIEYFEPTENRLIPAKLIKIRQTKAEVTNIKDGKDWIIPLYMINVQKTDIEIQQTKRGTLTKNELQVGDTVGFVNKQGKELHGEIIRLNPKSVTIHSIPKFLMLD